MRLLRIFVLIALCLAFTPKPAAAVTGFDSLYFGESAFLTLDPGQSGQFVAIFTNTGTTTWQKGTPSQVNLAACLNDKVTCNVAPEESAWNDGSWLSTTAYATTSRDSVARGQNGFFIYTVKVPASATGTVRFNGDLVLASSGARIHPEGYYQDATVSAVGNIPLPTPTPTPTNVPVAVGGGSSVPPSADLSITKTDSPDPVAAGGNITYTLTVTNAGPSDAAAVALSDAVPANTTFVSFAAPTGWTTATPTAGGTGTVTATKTALAASATAIFTLVVKVNQHTDSDTSISNTTTVTSTTSDPSTANNSATARTAVGPASANLSVTKTDQPDPVIAGSTITYLLTVTNAGPSDAELVSLQDTIPANTTFEVFTAPAGWMTQTPNTAETDTVTARTPKLAGGATATFTLTVRVNANMSTGTTITNTATVSAATSDPDGNNNSATATTAVVTSADVSISKTDSPDPVFAGFDLTYTVTVENTGPSDGHTVAFGDTIPAGTTFISFTQTAGPAVTTVGPPVGGPGVAIGNIDTLAAGASATFTLVVNVNGSITAGTTITNTATITSATPDSNKDNNTGSATTTVQQQAILCFDGTTDTASGQTGGAIYGGTCTKTGDRSATLNNIPIGGAGVYSGVYFDPSALTGDALSTITALSFVWTGSPTVGSGPRITVPVDTDGDHATDFYITIDARDCTTGGVVDAIHNESCTIWKNTDGTTPAASNWADLLTRYPTWRVSSTASANGGTQPFIIADGPGAWNISNVHMGN
jgi:uncharacterized repeat protein (TIGR01451 family)